MSERLILRGESNPLEILFTTGRIGFHPPHVDLELPVPALCKELERGFEGAEDGGEGPVDEPGDPVERPPCDPRLSLACNKSLLM